MYVAIFTNIAAKKYLSVVCMHLQLQLIITECGNLPIFKFT